MNFELLPFPTKRVFGQGTVNKVGEIAKNYGNSALIVTGKNAMEKYGYKDLVLKSLEKQGIQGIIFNEISPNPKSDEVNKAIDITKKNNCDLVIGLGGGSAIDAAKAISVGINYDSIEEIIGETINPSTYLPVIAIPTTAGAGAEVTKGSIITDKKRKVKLGIRSNALSPKVAIVDPELTYTLPKKITAETGFDALTHAIEPYIAKKANPITDTLTIKAIELISKNLKYAIGDEENLLSRQNMSLAALLGGINVFNASSCLPHRLQQAMGSIIEISHGAGLAAVYPSWLREVYPHAEKKLKKVENIFTNNGYKGVIDFMEKIGVNYNLRDLGVKENQIPEFVEKVTGNLENDPIPNIDKSLIRKIYQESY